MQNQTLLQFFHWYLPDDGQLWNQLSDVATQLTEWGITCVWTPPAQKAAAGTFSVGYDTYDLYDLGEFDQKGTVRTKYGTRKELDKAIKACHDAGIQVMADIVVNHKGGADEEERFEVIRVDPEDRNKPVSDYFEITAWTKFTFPGRKGKYSGFVWDYTCFSGVDYASDLRERAIFAIKHNYESLWEKLADMQKGNFDYLMYCDIEFRKPEVYKELCNWGEWMIKDVGFNCFRLDAIKHISPEFMKGWLQFLRGDTQSPLFAVGEYWQTEIDLVKNYIAETEGAMSLFDVPLHMRLSEASRAGNQYDMRTIFDGTLTQADPFHAVSFVDNHDSQPLQSLESDVQPWFKPIAYALILLREQGVPCIFYPDVYGGKYSDKGDDGQTHEVELHPVPGLGKMMVARKNHAYGIQTDYFDHPNIIGWTRTGNNEMPGSGCAVMVTNGDGGSKYMKVADGLAHTTFVNLLSESNETVELDEHGGAEFHVPPGGVSVWVQQG